MYKYEVIWQKRAMRQRKHDGSVLGGVLQAAATAMLLVATAFTIKAAFGGAGAAMGNLLTVAVAGVAGMACMAGAAAAERACNRAEAEEWSNRQAEAKVISITSPVAGVGIPELEAAEGRERRFVTVLDDQRSEEAGRGI
jgi:hypothetical protein